VEADTPGVERTRAELDSMVLRSIDLRLRELVRIERQKAKR